MIWISMSPTGNSRMHGAILCDPLGLGSTFSTSSRFFVSVGSFMSPIAAVLQGVGRAECPL
ncbi:hypothetical protein CBP35_20450 (plasmid) [Acidovorax carolinensis]|nr:hypothetical protein CBP35_20450 [Acidovorax carolinensis]